MKRLLGLALAIIAIASASANRPQTGDMRVMTYNIEWFSEDANPFRIEKLKSILEATNPTVVAVQEVQSKAALAQIFGNDWTIAIKDDPAEFQETGVVVRKPYEVVESDTVFKDPGLDFAFPGGRNIFRAVVKAPSGELTTFYSVHWKSRGGGRIHTDFQREAAAGMLAAYIKGKKEPNVVVLGDFNDCPDDVSVNVLETGNILAAGGRPEKRDSLLINLCEPLYDVDAITHGLSALYQGGDAPAAVVKGAKDQNEKLRGKDYNYPGDVHIEQILFDQILVSPALAKRTAPAVIFTSREALEGRTGTTRRDADGKATYEEKGTRASDHLPVYADIRPGQ
jgi:endonuclease/exonuclease/phosphatase family metal-dependent hydrolase